MDQEDPNELSDQIARIERLSSDLRLTLMSIRSPHTAYAVLLVELEWLGVQLKEIKKRLS
jgi:hypothetical protein